MSRMKTRSRSSRLAPMGVGGILALAAVAVTGCKDAREGSGSGEPRPGTLASVFRPPPHQGGAELWSANCTRCHNAVSPTAFSPPEWDLIVHHMRSRANLTGQEARLVAEFLKSGS